MVTRQRALVESAFLLVLFVRALVVSAVRVCISTRAICPCTKCTLTYTEKSMVARIIQQNKKGRGIQAIASDKKEAKRTVASVI
jgi:hypothetical protein